MYSPSPLIKHDHALFNASTDKSLNLHIPIYVLVKKTLSWKQVDKILHLVI